MIITPQLKFEHDHLLKNIQKNILDDLQTNLPKAKIAKQRINAFISLYDLFAYISQYNPNIENTKAFSKIKKNKDKTCNYFENVVIPFITKQRNKSPELFNIKGIELLEQGFLNHSALNAIGIFQIAHFWGSAQSYSLQKVRFDPNNRYIHFITGSKEYNVYNPDIDRTETFIYTKDILQIQGSIIYIFYRENEKNNFYLADKYLGLPFQRIQTTYNGNHRWSYISIQKLHSITPNQKLELLDQFQSLEIPENRKQEITTSFYFRGQQEKLKVLQRANNICENISCSKNIPFTKSDNSTYLEVHHVIPLSQNGVDNEKNLIALCPNCHREAHHGKKKELLRKEFQKIILTKYQK